MNTNPDDSAFAFDEVQTRERNQHRDCITKWQSHRGLTKREYFAAMAMQGICKNPNHIGGYLSAAIEAVNQADALINELNKP